VVVVRIENRGIHRGARAPERFVPGNQHEQDQSRQINESGPDVAAISPECHFSAPARDGAPPLEEHRALAAARAPPWPEAV